MALEVKIETLTAPTDAKEQTAEVVVEGRNPGKQKDFQIEVSSREPGKDKVNLDIGSPEDPKTN